MTNWNTRSAVEKAIGRANVLAIGPGVDGELWATNAFWAVPAERLDPLLTYLGHPLREPRVYKLAYGDSYSYDPAEKPPNIAHVLPSGPASPEANLLAVGSNLAYINLGDTGEHYVINHPDGQSAVRKTYLDFVLGNAGPWAADYRQAGRLKPLEVWAETLVRPDDGENRLALLGVIMPVRLA